jgi:hypothetical protein
MHILNIHTTPSQTLDLLLRDPHLRFLDFGLHLLSSLLCEVMMQVEPLRLFGGQLSASLLNLHNQLPLLAYELGLSDALQMEFLLQFQYLVSGALRLARKQLVDHFFLVVTSLARVEDRSLRFLYLGLKDRVVRVL